MNTGTGRIYKRGNVYWIDYSHRGERHRESSGSHRKKDAVALLKKRMGEASEGKLPARDEEKLRLDDALKAVEADFKANGKKSLGRIQLSYKHLRRVLGNTPLLAINTGRMRRYIVDRQEEGAANSTIRNELNALRRGLNLLHSDGLLSRVPNMPSIKVNNVRKGFLTEGDVRAVLRHLPENVKPVVEFAYLTGWRKSEVLGLKWSEVDFEAGTLRLEPGTTKNDEGRTFPFRALPRLEALLEDLRDRTRAVERKKGEIVPHVFHRDGKPVKSFRMAWANACKLAGCPDAWFHDLRRSAVRNLEKAGVARSVATKLTGHKTEAIYRRYAIADEVALAEGVEKLAKLHDGGRQEGRTVVPIQEAKEA